MKKIFLLLAVAGMTFLQGCEGDPGPQGPQGYTVEAETFEIRNVNFIDDGSGYFGIIYDLDPAILDSDSILMYRLKSTSGIDVWEPLPKTYYFDDGVNEQELDYNFDFTTNDISIYLGYTSPFVLQPGFIQNQVFRVVVIPGYLSNKIGNKDYNSVTKALKISEEDFTKPARN